MYKIYEMKNTEGLVDYVYVVNTATNSHIPFEPTNTDYQQFKVDVTEGAELQDADGNTMTAKEAQDFLKTLP